MQKLAGIITENQVNEARTYYHVLEDGGYGNIGHQGVYNTKEEAQKRADELTDMFPRSTFYVEASNSRREPVNVTMENQINEATGIDAVDYTVKILNNFKRSNPFDAPTILKKAESLKNYINNQYDTEEIGAEMAYTEIDDMIDALNNGDDIMTVIDNAIANLNLKENQESHYKDAEKDDAAHIDALEKDMKDDAKHTNEGKMTKSAFKAKIKEMILAELSEDSTQDQEITDDNADYDPLAEAEDYNAQSLYDMFEKEDLLNDRREYDAEDLMKAYPGLSKEEAEKLENMLQGLDEAKKDEEEVEDVTVDDTEITDAPEADITSSETTEVSGIQSNLQAAYAEAKALGDEKLITQIANTITYFTKSHILDTAPINESMFPMLKKILK